MYLNQPNHVTQLAEHWASIPGAVGLFPIVAWHIFQHAWCGHSLQV